MRVLILEVVLLTATWHSALRRAAALRVHGGAAGVRLSGAFAPQEGEDGSAGGAGERWEVTQSLR